MSLLIALDTLIFKYKYYFQFLEHAIFSVIIKWETTWRVTHLPLNKISITFEHNPNLFFTCPIDQAKFVIVYENGIGYCFVRCYDELRIAQSAFTSRWFQYSFVMYNAQNE